MSIINQPPENTDEGLARYLVAEQGKTNTRIARSNYFPPIYGMPGKPQNGNIYYFGDQILSDILWAGFWGYSEGEWAYLGGDQAVQAAYGGIKSNGVIPIPDLDSTWYTVDIFDTPGVVPPKGIIQDTVNSKLILPYAGVYSFSTVVVFIHNEVNSGRSIESRFINVSTGELSDASFTGTGRNVEITNLILPSFMLQVTDTSQDNNIALQIRSTDGYATVSMRGGMNASMISEIQL